jgi:unsaturated rhamnogalacturonyl hydrolase
MIKALLALALLSAAACAPAQKANDVTAPLHLSKPDYPTPYGQPSVADIHKVLGRVLDYLDPATPASLVDAKTGKPVDDYRRVNGDTSLAPGDFRLTSYEWGVTYAGMLLAGSALDDPRFTAYATRRLKLLADIAPYYIAHPQSPSPIRSLLEPKALDDAGAMCAAMIKAARAGMQAPGLAPLISICSGYVARRQMRLADGTLARNRPQPDTLWLDDLFMAVPALAQMGKLTGERAYYDDAVKQVLQFSSRMFNRDKGLYMHGWVQGMAVHPEFHWARANGWALMAMVELLDVLPPDHPGYPAVVEQLRAHVKGLAAWQDGTGFWHQLIDRSDTYLETSATAIYAYAMARAVNRGYIDQRAYAPVAILAWNAVAGKVDAQGMVQGTCVGTGMGFDPAFYFYRPVNPYAAHGYGPVLLAGAEVATMLKTHRFEINDSSLQLQMAQ